MVELPNFLGSWESVYRNNTIEGTMAQARNQMESSRGWVVAPKRYVRVLTAEPLIVILFGKRVFTDVIKLSILRWHHPRLSGWTLNPMTSIRIRDIYQVSTRYREKEKAALRQGQRLEWCSHKPKTPGATRSWKRPRSWKRSNLILDFCPPELSKTMLIQATKLVQFVTGA